MTCYFTEDRIAYCGAICMGLSLGGIRLSMAISNILTVLAVLCTLWYLHKTKYKTLLTLSKWYWIPLLVFGISLIPALINTEELKLALRYYGNNILYRPLGFFIFLVMLRDKPQYVKKAFIIACVLFGTEALYSYYMHFIGAESRAQGFNSNQPVSPFTTCICIYMAPAIVYLLDDVFDGKKKYFGMGLFFLSWIALLANDCRTGYVTAIILMTVLGWKFIVASKKKLFYAGIVCFVLGVFFVTNHHYYDRIMSIRDVTTNSSNRTRIALWKDSVVMWKDHPITGVGLRSWAKVHEKLYYENSFAKKLRAVNWAHPHNNYFLMLAEGGIIGMLGFLSLLGGLGVIIVSRLQKGYNPYWLMSLGVLLAYVVCGFFDSILWFSTPNRTFWTMLGMMMALAEGYKKE